MDGQNVYKLTQNKIYFCKIYIISFISELTIQVYAILILLYIILIDHIYIDDVMINRHIENYIRYYIIKKEMIIESTD